MTDSESENNSSICYNCGCPVTGQFTEGLRPMHFSANACILALKDRIATIEAGMVMLAKASGKTPDHS